MSQEAWNLNEVIRNKNYEKFILNDCSILTTLDEMNECPIYMALLINDNRILFKIKDYIQGNKFEPKVMNDDLLGSLVTILESFYYDNIDNMIDIYLKPLYTKESIDQLMTLLNQ